MRSPADGPSPNPRSARRGTIVRQPAPSRPLAPPLLIAGLLLIAVAGYMYWDLALGDDPPELSPPELSATAGP